MARAFPSQSSRIAGLVTLLLSSGCDKDLTRDYEFIVRVSSEPGRPLAGAAASLQQKQLGISDSSGAITLKVRGQEGDVSSIEIACPSGHRSPPPVLVPLRQVGHDANGRDVRPEFTAVCTPTSHSLVIAVRAEHGPHLPLSYLGRELARTDSSGAAHVVLDVESKEIVELVLDTSEQPRLRPKSPILRVQPGSRDEITAIHQDFTLEPERVVKKKAPTWRGPTRID
jgi:hypothetical protein